MSLPSNASIGNSEVDVFTIRPSIIQASFAALTNNERKLWLQSLGRNYRTTPIQIEAGCLIAGTRGKAYPIVAGQGMCVAPGSDGGATTYSPKALINDKYYTLRLTAAGTSALTQPATGSVAVSAIDRALPKGFTYYFNSGAGHDGGLLQLTADVAAGATSLPSSTIYTNTDVVSTQTGGPLNGYFHQGGFPGAQIRDMMLVADPATPMSPGSEGSRYYACDGIAYSAIGSTVENCSVWGFPGHGYYLTYPLNHTTANGAFSPWDFEKNTYNGLNAHDCLSGITIVCADSRYDQLAAVNCRDYGVQFIGNDAQGGTIHAYGIVGTGIKTWLRTFGSHWYGDSCYYGIDIAGTGSIINSVRCFNNTYSGLRIFGTANKIGAAILEHSATGTNGTGTGFTCFFSSSASYSSIRDMTILGGASGANGVLFGDNTAVALSGTTLNGQIFGAGTYGLKVVCPLSGCDGNLNIVGYSTCLHFTNDATLTGCNLQFKGATGGTIRWNDGTTGTIGTPNIPSAVSSANTITFTVL